MDISGYNQIPEGYQQTASLPGLKELQSTTETLRQKVPEMMKMATSDIEDTAEISDMARTYLAAEQQVSTIAMVDKLVGQ